MTTQQLLVAGLLLLFMLILANSYPRYVVGFMVLVLISVGLAHSSVITKFFNI